MYVKTPVNRLTRAEQQQRTREALLDAAIEVFVERGVEAATIEEITARVGFTRGAFYSNFTTKDELFLSTCDRFFDRLHTAADADAPDDSAGRSYDQRLARITSRVGEQASAFIAEIWLYARRHPEIRQQFEELHRVQLERSFPFARGVLRKAGVAESQLPLPLFANIIQSLSFGLHLKSVVDPDLDANAAMATAVDLIVAGLAARQDQDSTVSRTLRIRKSAAGADDSSDTV